MLYTFDGRPDLGVLTAAQVLSVLVKRFGSQRKLAEHYGLTDPSVSNWGNRGIPKARMAELGVSLMSPVRTTRNPINVKELPLDEALRLYSELKEIFK